MKTLNIIVVNQNSTTHEQKVLSTCFTLPKHKQGMNYCSTVDRVRSNDDANKQVTTLVQSKREAIIITTTLIFSLYSPSSYACVTFKIQ